MNPKIAEAHHRDPFLHELAITVYGHDNSQIELTHRVVTILNKDKNKYNIENRKQKYDITLQRVER